MKKQQIGWGFWLQWTIFMAVFISLSYVGIDIVERPVVTRLVSNLWSREAFMVSGLALLSSLVGIGQWLLLRPFLHRASWWGFAFAATYSVGTSLTEIASTTGIGLTPGFAINFLLLGPICGIWQWTILRTQTARSGWWIFTQIFSWLVMFGVAVLISVSAASIFGGIMDDYLPLSYALGGAALGAITGAVLIWLLRNPAVKTKKETAMSL